MKNTTQNEYQNNGSSDNYVDEYEANGEKNDGDNVKRKQHHER